MLPWSFDANDFLIFARNAAVPDTVSIAKLYVSLSNDLASCSDTALACLIRTGALDSKTGTEIKKMLKDLNAEGQTIVLITHDNNMALEAKRVVRISDGKLYNYERSNN